MPVYPPHEALAQVFYANRSWPNQLSPATVAAGISVILAILVLSFNRRRLVNQAWCLTLIMNGLWQGSVAAAQIFHEFIFVRLAVMIGGWTVISFFVLKDAIVEQRSTLRGFVSRVRWPIAIIPIYSLVFTKLFSTPGPNGHAIFGPTYWGLNLFGGVLSVLVLSSATKLILLERITGFRRREMKAFSVALAACLLSSLVSIVMGRIGGVEFAAWLAPAITIAGLLFFSAFIVDKELSAIADFGSSSSVWFLRGLVYVFTAVFLIVCFSMFGGTTPVKLVVWSGLFAVVLSTLPLIDHRLRLLAERRSASAMFLEVQTVTACQIEKANSVAELHGCFVKVLQRWSCGSTNIFLSDGVLSADWPLQPIPTGLLKMIEERGCLTPEMFERDTCVAGDELDYFETNRIGALVGCSFSSGDMLFAVFGVRASERPFQANELREALELLRQMQIGLAFARMRQTQRSDDRLVFYGRYAPQFAHELRNGLYLQAQLLRAIANGRGETVLASDAKAGLEKIEQLERLCSHFFNVGAVFKQPVQAFKLRDALQAIVEKAKAQIGNVPGTEVELRIDVPEDVQILANSDMLGIALQNLLLNSAEALAGMPPPRRIEVTAVMQFEKVRVLVRDNGPGLPASKIQDPFSPGLSQKKGGMGLGLSIVRDCIEAMGGTIGLRPPDGTGACFEITLVCPSQDRRDNPLHNSLLGTGQVRMNGVGA
jgi:signal transduction histidine kinase